MILNLNTTITACKPICRPVWRFWWQGRSNRLRASLQNSGGFGQDKNRCNSRVSLRCYRVDIQAGEREVGCGYSHLSVHIGRQRRPLGHFRRFNTHIFRVGCCYRYSLNRWVAIRITTVFTAVLTAVVIFERR